VRAFSYRVWATGTFALLGCTQTVTPPSLQSLAGSGQVTILCREMTTGEGRDRRACPDSDYAISDGEDRHTLALVTQTLRGEVAVVDLHTQTVLDANPLLLGKEFLPVGAEPVSIASTPGGMATFVATAEIGLEAIYALPTTCITAPDSVAQDDSAADKARKRARELTLWSACRLPGRPGKIAIVSDPTLAIPGTDPLGYRTGCVEHLPAEDRWRDDPWQPAKAEAERRTDCPANLEVEEQIAPVGRRKLLVTLPDQGQIAIFDAQAILNLDAGSWKACVPDAVISLSTDVPPPPDDQVIPPDWIGGVKPVYPKAKEPDGGFKSRPAGIAMTETNKLYVADTGVPLIHVVDLADPCSPREETDKALRPLDFDNPSRVVLTNELAVSDITQAGKAKQQRFLYAVDYDGPATVAYDTIITSNSIMAFELSDGASRTPIVRSHILDLPFDPADRIRFESPIKKLQIVTHDAPVVDTFTKTAEVGVLCNPYPDAPDGPGKSYRTTAAYDKGAAPRKLRGIFGAVTLATGQILAVDIEDWDAPCRRPKSNNPLDSGLDWLGCARDPALLPQYNDWFKTDDRLETLTVTDEASCNVIEPHRLRSGRYFRTDTTLGSLAPSLVTFPRLSSIESGDLPTGTSDVGHKQPQLLAVPYTDSVEGNTTPRSSDVFLNVGTTRYEQHDTTEGRIDVNPGTAVNNTLVLPMNEPRVYYPQESFSATYEGTVIAQRGNGWIPRLSPQQASDAYTGLAGSAVTIDTATQILLRDADALFCTNGVEDYSIALDTAKKAFNLTEESPQKAFAAAHADFVTFTADFDSTDPYWAEAKKTPVDASAVGGSTVEAYCPAKLTVKDDPYKSCLAWFGTKAEPKGTSREFIIRESQNDDLLIEPRSSTNADVWVARAHCCFRNVTSYEVRAGQQWVVRGSSLLSRVKVGENNQRCERDLSPRRTKLRSRVFEIASETACTKDAKGSPVSANCAIGAVVDPAVDVCRTQKNSVGVLPSEFTNRGLPEECLYNSLKGRFAIYRGHSASVRDMAFKWTVTGGFSVLAASIASSTVGYNVLPMDMIYSESLDAFIVVDGASGGLNLIGLSNFSALGQPYL